VQLVWDRGTLLVHDPPRDFAIRDIDGIVWDHRVGRYRAAARRYGEIRARLTAGGVRFSDEVRTAGQSASVAGWRRLELRPYQEAALDAWELGSRRGILALPTGSGKTRVALAAMARTGLTTLCLVPTRALLDQWLGEVAAACDGPVGCLGDGRRELGAITVATFESAYRWMDRIGNRFGLLVVDEAHHFGVGVRDEVLEMSIAEARLGLTATPAQDEDVSVRMRELIGPVVYELSIGDLAGSYLAELESITVRVTLTEAERAEYDRLTALFQPVWMHYQRSVPGLTWAEFAGAAARTEEGRRALAAWRRRRALLAFTERKKQALTTLLARHRDARMLVFTADNDAAYVIARQHLIMPLTCDIDRRERVDALERFRRGELKALVSARVLNEGVDVPDADVAVIVGGSLGQREHVQRVGRLLRPGVGKRAIVYELVCARTREVAQARRRRAALAARCSA
jgi:superfamily II DNA or RNA helicase